jgi:glycosyltransferase involved in cell wall biosynthesis
MGTFSGENARTLLAQAGLEEAFQCLGALPRERYLAYVGRADVFVRPSLVDGDALSVREALALGRTVVASDTDARPEGVILFRRGDANDLAEKVAVALETAVASGPPQSSYGSLNEILSVYEAVSTPRRRA